MTARIQAVWSHWSSPLLNTRWSGWPTFRHYLVSFVLSHGLARQHGYQTILITDTSGRDLLADGIQIPFDDLRVDLDALRGYHPLLWNSGKVLAYGLQSEPFIHLDNDVYLWERLPARLTSAPLFAQNPEFAIEQPEYYRISELESLLTGVGGAMLPTEWRWCRELLGDYQRSFNTGIFGGVQFDFIQHYSSMFLKLARALSSRIEFIQSAHSRRHAGTLEMLLPGMLLDYHRGNPGSPFRATRIETLFPTPEAAYLSGESHSYTHLLGGSKRKSAILQRLDLRVKREYPREYERCEEYANYLTDHNTTAHQTR